MDLPFLTSRHINSVKREFEDFGRDSKKPMPNYLLTNPLSGKWKVSVLKYKASEHPLQLAALPLYYAVGMLGYLVSIPVRVVGFGKDVAMLGVTVLVPCYGNGNYFSKVGIRFKVLGGSAADVLIAGVGVFVPPLAYFFDEKLQSHTNIHAHSMTQWSHDALATCKEIQIVSKGPFLVSTSMTAKEAMSFSVTITKKYFRDLDDYMEGTAVLLSVFVLSSAFACNDEALGPYGDGGDQKISELRKQVIGLKNFCNDRDLSNRDLLNHLAMFVLKETISDYQEEVKTDLFKNDGARISFDQGFNDANQALLSLAKKHPEVDNFQLVKLVEDIVVKGKGILNADLQEGRKKEFIEKLISTIATPD